MATCKDCKEGENIHDFGICRCPVPADLPEREKIELIVSLDEVGRPYRETGQKCMPVFMEEWQQVQERTMIYVKDGEKYEVTLTNKAIIVCKYGGWITIDEVPVATVEPEEFFIAPWLVGYKGKPNTAGGKSVTYDVNGREKLKEINPGIDWYSYELQTEKNPNCVNYLEDQEFINTKYGEGELTDSNGRYWITLGPKVFIYDYPDDGKCEADDFGEHIGCRVDVVLYNTKDQSDAYIKCVFSGNIKAHTFNNGVYQAGYPYPESWIAKKEPYSLDYVDGSIVEFTGLKPSTNGKMSEYIVKELLVYPK